MEWLDSLKIGKRIFSSVVMIALLSGIFTAGIYCLMMTDAAGTVLRENPAAAALVVIAEIVVIILLGIITVHKVNQPIKQLCDSYKSDIESMNENYTALKLLVSGDTNIAVESIPNGDPFRSALIALSETLKQLRAETARIASAAADGTSGSENKREAFSGIYRDIIVDMVQALRIYESPIRISADYFTKIGSGEIPGKITDNSLDGFPALQQSIHGCLDSLSSFTEDMETLMNKAVSGNLRVRGNAAIHSGNFAKVFEQMNRILESVILPLEVAEIHIQQIGRGEIPDKITEEYQGDFKLIKDSINACIDGLSGLLSGKKALERMALNDFSVTVSGSCGGIFAEITESINTVSGQILHIVDVLNRISQGDLRHLSELKAIGRRCDSDTLTPALILMMESIKELADETEILSRAAVEGRLSVRGESEKLKGDYAGIIEGINKTLDSILKPVQEASAVLQEMAKGNLRIAMEGDYSGDHAVIKNALNDTIESTRSYIKEISLVLSEICGGNLNLSITADYKGDFTEIKDSLNRIIMNLNQVMSDFAGAAEQVSSGSRQVSMGSQALAQGSTEQASSLQELTAAIGEIAEQSKDNAIKANEVYQLAKGARDGGAKGNQTMNEMLKSMQEINESSVNISKIIKVIDDIAFQTNILALNAAVEAARAGSHGKGFAVVAEEVRNLAARSAKAAEETTELIEGSIQKVHAGTEITNEIAAVLKEIAEGAVISTEKLSVISKASNDQATGIDQINKGIEQISQVVQSNSATAEQSAAASQELSGQAELLKEMAARFRFTEISYEAKLLSHVAAQQNQMTAQPNRARLDLSFNDASKY